MQLGDLLPRNDPRRSTSPNVRRTFSSAAFQVTSSPHAICLVAIVAGLAIRVWLAAAFQGDLNVDNAKVGLMAMHALRGRFYAFFWSQPQLGSLESIVIASIFAAFGVSDFTLALGLLPWLVVFSVALYFVTHDAAGRARTSRRWS